MKKSKDYAISFARGMAMLAVVVCHFLQFYGSVLAFFLNFNVHMFLFVSGYLYSMKRIDNVFSFYRKCARKLLIDYYIYICIFIGISMLTGRVQMDCQTVFHLLIMKQFTPEVGQFWFLPYILFCYALTPILHAVLDEFDRHNGIRYLLSIALLIMFVEITLRNFFDYFTPVWMESYILGMVVCRCKHRKLRLWNCLKAALCGATVIAYSILLWGMANIGFPPPAVFIELFYYAQSLLGISAVLFLCWAFRRCRTIPAVCKHILDWSDKYAFDVYIVHNLYIQGSYSLLAVMDNPVLGILLICLLIPVSAMLLRKAADLFRKKPIAARPA